MSFCFNQYALDTLERKKRGGEDREEGKREKRGRRE